MTSQRVPKPEPPPGARRHGELNVGAETTRECHDCGARPGTLHEPHCDVERCSNCGRQRVSCDCPDRLKTRRLPWTGEWPGVVECRELGLFAKLVPGAGWVPCDQSDPDAEPDINRLHKEAVWDRRAGRFVRR